MVNWTEYVLSAGKMGVWVVILLLVIIVLGLIVWWVISLLKYNKRIILRTMTGGGNVLIKATWAKQKHDKKSGSNLWKIKGIKEQIPRPPPKAISITKGGKEWVDLYDTGQGQYVPAISSNPKFAEEESFVKSFQPITESQRSAYIDQVDKAALYKTKGWQDVLQVAIPIIGVVMIISVFLLFLGEGMAPIIKQAEIASSGAKDFKIAAEMMSEAVSTLRGHQVIGERPGNSVPGNFTPPD